MDLATLHAFFAGHFPHAGGFRFLDASADGVAVALDTTPAHLRPGGTVSGPTLMTLADTAMYASLLARLGAAAAGPGVTSSLEMHFLARPDPGTITGKCRLLKVGRRLCVGAVELSRADGALVAFATVTYALPGSGLR
jgi:uncharacterized protein (TIGR00369 family)